MAPIWGTIEHRSGEWEWNWDWDWIPSQGWYWYWYWDWLEVSSHRHCLQQWRTARLNYGA